MAFSQRPGGMGRWRSGCMPLLQSGLLAPWRRVALMSPADGFQVVSMVAIACVLVTPLPSSDRGGAPQIARGEHSLATRDLIHTSHAVRIPSDTISFHASPPIPFLFMLYIHTALQMLPLRCSAAAADSEGWGSVFGGRYPLCCEPLLRSMPMGPSDPKKPHKHKIHLIAQTNHTNTVNPFNCSEQCVCMYECN